MRSTDHQPPENFPDLGLPERTDPGADVVGPKGPSNPHIQLPGKEEKIQTPAEVDDPRSLLAPPAPANTVPAVPRFIAAVLAFNGIGCGLLMLPEMVATNAVRRLTLAPFYLLTIGYLVRALAYPPLGMRRLLWLLSILVHGLWTSYGLWLMATVPVYNLAYILTAWWAGETAVSIWALLTERPDGAMETPRAGTTTQELIVIGIIIFMLIAVAMIVTVFYLVRLR